MAGHQPGSDCLVPVPDSISVSFLPDHPRLSGKATQKGLNYFVQGYIHSIRVYDDERTVHVYAKCWKSMCKNQPPHELNVEIDVNAEKLTDAYCSCKAGLSGRCSHVIGLLKSLQGFKLHNYTHVPELQSCTSLPQQWHVPRGNKIEPVPINHVVVARPTENRKRKPVLCQLDTNTKPPKISDTDVHLLQQMTGTPLEYMIKRHTPTVQTPLGDVQMGSYLSYQTRNMKILQQGEKTNCMPVTLPEDPPIKLSDEFQYINRLCIVQDPEKLEIDTRAQANSQLWRNARSKRVTASNFGRVVNRKKKPTDAFLKSLFQMKSVHARSLSYGRRNEINAKKKYLETFPFTHMHECGLEVNNEFSFLGATPDGRLCCPEGSGIMEIKCPYTARQMTVEEAWYQIPTFFLQKDEAGTLHLKRSHTYYAQVQGQLMITGSKFCEFIVYTKKDIHVERVYPDLDYMEGMLQMLSVFYRDTAKAYLELDNEP